MKVLVVPYGRKIVVSGKETIEKPDIYELESRTEGRDGTKLVLVSSFYGVIDRWTEARRVFGVLPLIEPMDVEIRDGFVMLPVLAQGMFDIFKQKLPPEIERILQWYSSFRDYIAKEEDYAWYIKDCPAVRLGLCDLFDKTWFLWGDRPLFDAEREIKNELLDEEMSPEEISPIVGLAKLKRSPKKDASVWQPSPLFDFRWSNC